MKKALLYLTVLFYSFAETQNNKKIIFHNHGQPQSSLKLAIVTLSVGKDRQILSQQTLRSLKNYSKIHKYDIYEYRYTPMPALSPSWNKIPAMIETLKLKKYDWIIWVDDDIMITNNDINLRNLISEHGKGKSLIVGKQPETARKYAVRKMGLSIDQIQFCSGIFALKQEDWSINYLEEVLNNAQSDNYNLIHHEEGYMSLLAFNPKNVHRVCLLEHGILSSIDIEGLQEETWKPSDFNIHICLGSLKSKLERLKYFCSKINQG